MPERAPVQGLLRLLLVEDDQVDRRAVRRVLDGSGLTYALVEVSRVSDAREALSAGRFDCVLLDLDLPDGHGLDLLGDSDAGTLDAPVVVLTGAHGEEWGRAAIRRGAEDYLVKGQIDGPAMVRAIRYAIERHRHKRKLASTNQILSQLASRDPLTDLLNRRGLESVLEQQARPMDGSGGLVVAMVVDLDRFKEINDKWGYHIGDRVLIEVAHAIRSTLRSTDQVARVGGDEFLVLIPDADLAVGKMLAERIRAAIARRIVLLNETEAVRPTASIGVSLVPTTLHNITQLLASCQAPLRASKEHGRNQVRVAVGLAFSLEGGQGEESLGLALHEPLVALRRPIADLKNGEIRAWDYRAQTRRPLTDLDEAGRGEDDATSAAVDLRCLETCVAAAIVDRVNLPVHLTIKPSTLRHAPTAVLKMIEDLTDLPVVLLLSARWLPEDWSELRPSIVALRASGAQLGVKRVGAGHTVLEALLQWRPEVLKADPTFIPWSPSGEGGDHALERLNVLAGVSRALGAQFVATGIDTPAQHAAVQRLGVQLGQGRLFQGGEDL